MTPNLLEPPAVDRTWSAWQHFSRREKAFAVWLLCETGWPGVDLTRASAFNTDTGVVVVEWRGNTITAICGWEVEQTLAEVERKYGSEARLRAEATIGG